MSVLTINGRRRIEGTHIVPGNKNAALPMLAAAILTDEAVTLDNLPLIRDVKTSIDILRDLGVCAELDEKAHSITIKATTIAKTVLSSDLSGMARGSILFAGPMLARVGEVLIPGSGGDAIGRRPIDAHISGFRALGVSCEKTSGGILFRTLQGGLSGAYILLDEASVTGTENIVMAAVLAKGKTTIYNAACEPHVQNLCQMLNSMGAKIEGIGTNRLKIEGVERLHGTRYRIGPDYIDAGSYIAAAVITGGKLVLEGIEEDDFRVLEKPFAKFGVRWEIEGNRLVLPPQQILQTQNTAADAIPKIEDGIWPAFPSDLMSILIVLATQSRGTTLFFEKMFESRLFFVDQLVSMGANLVLCDPHRVLVTGPVQLRGGHLKSPDIRAGISLVIAALVAEGESTIMNAESIDRGYERVEQVLSSLGADIRRCD